MRLTTAQTDRACGAVLATAAGDALGAGYEFGAGPGPEGPQIESHWVSFLCVPLASECRLG